MINDIWSRIPIPTQEWIIRNYITGLKILLVFLCVLLFNRYSSRLLRHILLHVVRHDRLTSKADREKRLNTLVSLTGAVLHAGAWIIGIGIAVDLMGINTAPFFASAGLVGAGVVFGAQNLIKDFVAGLFIISENQYRVGDTVEILGVSGIVQSIGLRTTVLRDQNGSVHHVPNGSIVVTTNKSMGYGAINMDLTVPPATDLMVLERVINQAGERLAATAELKDFIVKPPHFARVSELNGSGVTVKIIGKTTGGKQLEVKSALLLELKKGFDKEKINIANPVVAPAAAAKKK